MAGPTPVSALIHAATMVTSGVYLMTRVAPILAQSYDWAPSVIAWVGVITALFAATIAVAQNDIKRVLAYSTISQLGYMFLAVGSGAYVAAVFHMVTHAFFKALMFLGSGSVIHGMHDEQDMRRMGALKKLMPITAGTFIVGWLAIAGVPPFAGFWSKDEILLFAYDKSPVLWAVGLVTALLTAFYMSRQVFMVFFGDARWTEPAEHAEAADEPAPHAQPHESPWLMTLPLVVLAGAVGPRGRAEPAVHPRHQVPRAVARASDPRSRAGDRRGHRHQGRARRHRGRGRPPRDRRGGAPCTSRSGSSPSSPRSSRTAGATTARSARFVGGPGRAAFEATAALRQGRRRRRGQRRRRARAPRRHGSARSQTGYVRSYALGVAVGVVALLAYFLSRVSF